MTAATTILSAAYAATGVVAAVGYVPTLRDLVKGKPSACPSSYLTWSGTAAVTTLYAAFVAHDILFTIVSAVNLAFCVAIYALAVRHGRECGLEEQEASG